MLEPETLDPKYRLSGGNRGIVSGGAALPFILTANKDDLILYRVDLISRWRQPLMRLPLSTRWIEVHPEGHEFYIADTNELQAYTLSGKSCELRQSTESELPASFRLSPDGRLLHSDYCLYETGDLSSPPARYDHFKRGPPHVMGFDVAKGCIYGCSISKYPLTVFTMQASKVKDYELKCGPPSHLAVHPSGGQLVLSGSRQVVWVKLPD